MSPYIPQDRREEIDGGSTPQNAGELNYKITATILKYLYEINCASPNTYGDYNEVLGVLEACKFELYRKRIASYQDMKCAENGGVY